MALRRLVSVALGAISVAACESRSDPSFVREEGGKNDTPVEAGAPLDGRAPTRDGALRDGNVTGEAAPDSARADADGRRVYDSGSDAETALDPGPVLDRNTDW